MNDSTPSAGVDQAPATPSARTLYAVYAAGLTTQALNMMMKVVVPLWALQLQMSPTMIGIAVGAGGFLPFLLSIHGGVLMDRLGTRRVNLFFAVIGSISVVLFPFMPWASAVIVLQAFSGLTLNMGWMGAQSLIVQFAPGDTTVIGRFSIASRVGNLVSPVLTGVVWDLTGPLWTFLFIALWSLANWVAILNVPNTNTDIAAAGKKISTRELLPSLSDYVDAFAMMAIPAVAFIVANTFLRISSSAVQASFYVVYLEHIGISGTIIGVLLGVAEGFGMFGAGIAGRIERALKPHWTLLLFHGLSLLFVFITPFLGGILALIFVAAALRGNAQGLSQPVMFAILSRAVSPTEQGRSIGLRTTVNRVATMIIPVIMGLVVDLVGLEEAFALLGAVLIGICILVALVVLRIPAFKT